MKLPVRPARIGVFLHRPNSLFRLFVYSFLAEFLVLISYAETPVLRVWTADQQSVLTSSDVIDTNQWYMADRFIGLQAGVETDATVATVSITGLTFTCSIPSSLALSFLESNNETPVYIQWNPVYTSLVYHAAEPLTNWQWRSSSVSLVASNAWIHPLVHAQRTVSPTRLVPNVETEQTVVCNIVIPPGALNGQAVFQVQPFFWDIDSGSLDISVLSNTCSSTSFFIDDTISSFVCTHPDALAGTYSFTSYLKVTSHDERPVHYAPGIQIMYSRTQTGWDIRSRIPSRSLEHVYDNGLRVNTSSPIPVLWDEQQM